MHNVSKPPKTVCMMQTELTKRPVAQIGEAIPHELGSQMIRDFQVANPQETKGYVIGNHVIEQILAQPGCCGIKFYNAYNESGVKTLVYVGVDQEGQDIVRIPVVNETGSIEIEKAMVADRAQDTSDNGSWIETLWELFF